MLARCDSVIASNVYISDRKIRWVVSEREG